MSILFPAIAQNPAEREAWRQEDGWGFYLQDELLEEEKHERPQRNYFFLGRPRAICGRREGDKQSRKSQERYLPFSHLALPSSPSFFSYSN